MVRVPASWKIIAFTANLIVGLFFSQLIGNLMDKDAYKVWTKVVTALTMWALSFIMINVGYEFTIDKGSLCDYVWDYLVAMTAAAFPWVFVAVWLYLAVGNLTVVDALLIARFAAPTSAGILFSMLEGAGLKETWLFSKARILAIFDDLDTIILMIPLKIFKEWEIRWELGVVVVIMIGLVMLAWVKLHAVAIPHGWHWTLFYAALVAAVCKLLHHFTHESPDVDDIHIEVLLPAFVFGCIIDTPASRHELQAQRAASDLKRKKKEAEVAASAASNRVRPAQGTGDDQEERVQPPSKTPSAPLSPTYSVPPNWIVPEGQEDQIDGAIVTGNVNVTEVHPTPAAGAEVGEHSASVRRRSASKEAPGPDRLRGAAWSDGSGHGSGGGKPPEHGKEQGESPIDHLAQTTVSLVFMVLVGLSMPLLVGPNAKFGGDVPAGMLVVHIGVVSILMVLGKMFPIFCYRDEADFSTRLAICLGMCPRGEVGASIIVLAVSYNITGPSVVVAMGSLAVNLVLSGGFIAGVKALLQRSARQSTKATAAATAMEPPPVPVG
uniref:Cation/H+ exchanger domain-containing protein n=1 Tax=Zooxanthella nutricula TaxID=1333877 RepID=A0A7S2M2N9_9DINO|mmetsp:Transcript_70898/g.217290  ORF Transcript_70898/g.217290 Transcript_70898/m.217290 type:complete len:550 (+) Transcript_70898:124-1773(+)